MSTSEAAAGISSADQNDTTFGHPTGVFICFATEMWERFSFYGMKFLLVLYLIKYHLFTDTQGLHVLAAYAGLVYALPLIGGMISDRYLGMRKAVIFGGLLLCFGHLGMAFEGHQAIFYAAGTTLAQNLTLADGSVLTAGTVLSEDITIRDTFALQVFYFSLALITAGVGFLKPNISTIVGRLYTKDDPRRDSGFTIFYMGINIGSFVGTLLCGYLGEKYGWSWGFGLAGIGMVIGLIVFIFGQKFLHGHAEAKNPELLKEIVFAGINKEWFIYLASIASLLIIWILVQSHSIVLYTQSGLGGIFLLWLTWYMSTKCTKEQREQLLVLVILMIVSIVFWALFEQSSASMTLYADRVVNRTIFSTTFFQGDVSTLHYALMLLIALPIISLIVIYRLRQRYNTSEKTILLLTVTTITLLVIAPLCYNIYTFIPAVTHADPAGVPFIWQLTASQTGSFNALFIILFAPVMAWLWVVTANKDREPRTPVKFALALIQVGLGFGALVIGATMPNNIGQVALIWLAVAYFLHSTGELCLSPVGLSAVTKLSLPSIVGIMMGAWFLATSLSETAAALMSTIAAVDTTGGKVADIHSALATYTDFFNYLLWVGVGSGVLLWLAMPPLKRWMHGIH